MTYLIIDTAVATDLELQKQNKKGSKKGIWNFKKFKEELIADREMEKWQDEFREAYFNAMYESNNNLSKKKIQRHKTDC